MEKNHIMFSILVVALNPGEKLIQTVDSILMQEEKSYEVLVKDGMSRDGSVEALKEHIGENERVRIVRAADKSIYEGMNQAILEARGKYVLFLNCGDTFYDKKVLGRTREAIEKRLGGAGAQRPHCVFYGNTFCEQTHTAVHSAPRITGFTCYRNIPCHQSCFYDRALFSDRQYEPGYRIRADYEHFLWCYYVKKAEFVYMDQIVAAYEGGGYSESRENRRRDREEHREITALYMSRSELLRYRLWLLATLAPLRSAMAQSPVFSGLYHSCKDALYRRKKG